MITDIRQYKMNNAMKFGILGQTVNFFLADVLNCKLARTLHDKTEKKRPA